MSGRNGIAFPYYLNRWQRAIWDRLPLRLRSAWSPYDNWLRGYVKGLEAGRANMEAKWIGSITGEGPYANYPPPAASPGARHDVPGDLP